MELVQFQDLPNLVGRQGPGYILLVGENEDRGESLFLFQQKEQLVAAELQAHLVGTVDDPYQSIRRVFKVVSPVRSNGLLASHVPEVELVVPVKQGLNVKAEGRFDGVNGLIAEAAKTRRLSGVIQSENEETNLFFLLFDL